jgi:hypothetical protein
MFQGIPQVYNWNSSFTYPGVHNHSEDSSHAYAFLLMHPVYEQSFIDRYTIYHNEVFKINLTSSANYIRVKYKSYRHIVQMLDVPNHQEDDTQTELFPWFRLVMYPIYYSGLCRKLIYDLSPSSDESDEPPV